MLQSLSDLDLSINHLSSSISSFSELINLIGLYPTSLDPHSNRLTGSITEYFGHLSQLQCLDISENLLHGLIPHELCDLADLRFLNISNNMLHGILDCSQFIGWSFLNTSGSSGSAEVEITNFEIRPSSAISFFL